MLLGRALYSANILKGTAAKKRMIAALTKLSGFPFQEPVVELLNAGQCVAQGWPKKKDLSAASEGRDDGE